MPCEGSGLLRRDETSRLRICRLIFNWFTPDYLSHARRVAHNVSQLRLRAQFIVSPKSKVQSVSWPLLAELTEWLLSVCIAQGTLYKASQPRARPDPVMMRTMMMAMVITMSSSRISNQCHWEGSWEVVRVIKAGFRSTSASFVHCVHTLICIPLRHNCHPYHHHHHHRWLVTFHHHPHFSNSQHLKNIWRQKNYELAYSVNTHLLVSGIYLIFFRKLRGGLLCILTPPYWVILIISILLITFSLTSLWSLRYRWRNPLIKNTWYTFMFHCHLMR